VGALLAAGGGSAAAYPGLEVIYAPSPAANAIYDGQPQTGGSTGMYRQSPIFDDPRWPVSSQIGKVSGRDLAKLDAGGMAAALQAELRRFPLVSVDELVADEWTVRPSGNLVRALDSMGALAGKVVLYVGPALVSRIGATDPRNPLTPDLAAAMEAIQRAGTVMLGMYGGGGVPFGQTQFATYPTRWLGRWTRTDAGNLHLLFGPGKSIGQATLWQWARASVAGRTLLANGAGAFGLESAAEGRAWLDGRNGFITQPTEPPPAGDTPIPVGGGLTVAAEQGAVRVTLTRPARVVVLLIAANGQRRSLGAVQGPTVTAGVRLAVPPTLRKGTYRIQATALGQGLKDVVGGTYVHVGAPPLRVVRSGSGLRVTVGAGQRAVVYILAPNGRRRVLGRVAGRATEVVRLPRALTPGRYRAVASAVGRFGGQRATASFVVR
jgi:hypothetical protein